MFSQNGCKGHPCFLRHVLFLQNHKPGAYIYRCFLSKILNQLIQHWFWLKLQKCSIHSFYTFLLFAMGSHSQLLVRNILNTVIYVLLLLGVCILIVWLPWLRFFRAFSSVVRQMPGYNSQRRGTPRTLPNFLCCSMYCVFCVVLCIVCE